MIKNNHTKIIGLVGGVGPYAGLDLKKKIFDNTKALTDQEHLEVYLLSCSKYISDRSEFLKNPSKIENPGIAIFNVIKKLHQIGASIIGIPCNTAHSSLIFNKIIFQINNANLDIELLNMIEETKSYIKNKLKNINKIGLLATLGTYQSMVYQQIFNAKNEPEILTPNDEQKKKIHESIYDKSFGIKAFSNPVTEEATTQLKEIINILKQNGAQAIIMGCTEIPLALKKEDTDLPLIDPTNVLARALISRVDKNKLKKIE